MMLQFCFYYLLRLIVVKTKIAQIIHIPNPLNYSKRELLFDMIIRTRNELVGFSIRNINGEKKCNIDFDWLKLFSNLYIFFYNFISLVLRYLNFHFQPTKSQTNFEIVIFILFYIVRNKPKFDWSRK